ncbi:MAG: DNA polymerase IV [Desulfuromonas sp.]|nr:MAG: DNA polymerase IV [Desulfuromonas sp.]
MSPFRTILHIDMNAFFAAVEQQSRPALRGRPVAVIGGGSRTVITTCSYEARAFGVRTGMRVGEGRQLCSDLELVVADPRKYADTSSRIMALFAEYTPLVEVFSIDEAFLDVTGSLRLFGDARRIAHLIKARIYHQFGLTCSVGIASNKLLAKLASDMQKPDGLTELADADIPRLFTTLPVGDLCGVGPRLQRQLHQLGIRTCRDLATYPLPLLKRRFGVIGARLQRMGRGEDDAPVRPEVAAEPVRSVGHSLTLDRDLDDREAIAIELLQLSERVGRRARRYGLQGRTIHLTLRYADFTTFGRQKSYIEATNSSREIHRRALGILDTLVLEQPVRLLGVRLDNLETETTQGLLFEVDQRPREVNAAVDALNDRFGSFSVTYASLLDALPRQPLVIAPSWRPQGIRYTGESEEG